MPGKNKVLVDNEKDEVKMETVIKKNKRSLLKLWGQYPVWMDQRQRKRLKAKTERTEEKGSKAKGRERAWPSSPLKTVKCCNGQKFGRNVCTDLNSH